MKRMKLLFVLMLAAMLVFAAVFLGMPFAADAALAGRQTPFLVLGILLWSSFLLSCLLLTVLSFLRRRAAEEPFRPARWGLLRFFSNPLARILDAFLVFSLAAFLLLLAIAPESYLLYAALFLLVLSVQLHGVFNGQIYQFLFCKKRNGGKHS